MSRRTTHSTTPDTGSRAGKRLILARLHADRTAIKPSPPRRLTTQFAGDHYLENAGARGDASPGPGMTARGMVVWFGHEVRSGNQGRPDRDTPARQARTDRHRRAGRSLVPAQPLMDCGGRLFGIAVKSPFLSSHCSSVTSTLPPAPFLPLTTSSEPSRPELERGHRYGILIITQAPPYDRRHAP